MEAFQDRLASVLYDFYENNIDSGEPVTQTAFHWNSYKKASQLCYTLGMEILTDINRGRYTPGSFLPSLEKMAKEKQVSVSTIRRTLSLLNSIGVTKSVNGHGTKILHKNEISENCDLTQPAVRRRLSDYAQSLQIGRQGRFFLILRCLPLCSSVDTPTKAAGTIHRIRFGWPAAVQSV